MRRLIVLTSLVLGLLASSCVGPLARFKPHPCPCEGEQPAVEAKPAAEVRPAPKPAEPPPCKPAPVVATKPEPAPKKERAPEPKPEPPKPQPAVASGGCTPGDAMINSVLWVQTAAEYRAATIGIFAAAKRAVDAALADPTWVAAVEDKDNASTQPPAIILDIDETVIDNTRFQARAIQEGKTYDGEIWEQWVGESGAAAVPGAAEFLTYARDKGVKVFYVSNRTTEEEDETLRNLQRLGYPVEPGPDGLLMRAERTAWAGSEKSLRREFVGSSHRVILVLGDDLNDFVDARDLSITERDEIVARTRAWWGTRWFMIPNPMYGSWERAATGGTGTPCEQMKKKVETLRE